MHPAAQHQRVLIAEDHADSREALRALLESMGYDVEVAGNGREAVDAALRARPDLILMDVMMPVMDGLEATRTLRASPQLEGVPIIAITAMDSAHEQSLRAGCDAFLMKPIDVRRLMSDIYELLENPRR